MSFDEWNLEGFDVPTLPGTKIVNNGHTGILIESHYRQLQDQREYWLLPLLDPGSLCLRNKSH